MGNLSRLIWEMLPTTLDSSFFSAGEGFRDGRQKGFLENGRNLAWTGRLEYRPRPGLNLGTSFWTGETGFSFRDLDGRLKMFEFDGRYRVGRFEGRGQFVTTHLGDAAEINQAIRRQVGINPNIASEMRGFYLEGASSLVPSTFPHDLVAFYRYESFDTQYRMPQGFFSLEQFDRAAHVLGLTYFPHPDIALKVGETVIVNFVAENRSNERTVGSATFNVTPAAAGAYFNKIQCFCFTRQVLQPGEKIMMPVQFFIDPAMDGDNDLRSVKTITLSYTFYPMPEAGQPVAQSEQDRLRKILSRVSKF